MVGCAPEAQPSYPVTTMLQALYDALEDAPRFLRGCLYTLLLVVAVVFAPLVMLVAAIRDMGRANRLPTVSEAVRTTLYVAPVLFLWALVAATVVTGGVVVETTDCPDEVVRQAIRSACEAAP